MKKHYEYPLVFSCGAVIYNLIEVLFRGYTHWTMSLAGGAAFLMIYLIEKYAQGKMPLFIRCAIDCAVITAVEFTAGCIVNLWLKMDVWDYSNLPYNLLGQISLLFSAMWFLLSFPASLLCRFIRKHMICKADAKSAAYNQFEEI